MHVLVSLFFPGSFSPTLAHISKRNKKRWKWCWKTKKKKLEFCSSCLAYRLFLFIPGFMRKAYMHACRCETKLGIYASLMHARHTKLHPATTTTRTNYTLLSCHDMKNMCTTHFSYLQEKPIYYVTFTHVRFLNIMHSRVLHTSEWKKKFLPCAKC